MCRDKKHYSQQADYAGFDGVAGQDQLEALTGSEGELSEIQIAFCLQSHPSRLERLVTFQACIPAETWKGRLIQIMCTALLCSSQNQRWCLTGTP